jgi:hypothetical protein
MNGLVKLINQAQSLGAKLWADGENLKLDIPEDFPDSLIGLLRENKGEIMTYFLNMDAQRLSNAGCLNYDLPGLLAWASNLSSQKIILEEPIFFLEAEMRPVQVFNISSYAARQLTAIASSRLWQPEGGWSTFTSEWWQEREKDAVNALANMRQALNIKGEITP